jgi:23S rRNA G2069 N7-methylase RlmK/C1962 C5-methylase RlmI
VEYTEFSKTEAQADMFANRLAKRQKHLKKWARRTGAGVYRLYDRDIPEIPLVLDWYNVVNDSGDPAQGETFSGIVAGSLYKRPYEKDDEEAWLSAMKEAASSALGLKPEMIFLRERKKQQGAAQYEKISE